ncbi:MAG: hypothetical protein ACE5FW_01960 [Candidatus Aenigmatarchaeota archaeon]
MRKAQMEAFYRRLTPSSKSLGKNRKGQMFVVTMVFLTGLIFAVQQLLFQYSLVDLSEPMQRTDLYLLESAGSIFNITMEGLDCADSGSVARTLQDLVELDTWLARQTFRGYSLELEYNGLDTPNLDCNGETDAVLVLDIRIIGPGSETERIYIYTQPLPEEVGWD